MQFRASVVQDYCKLHSKWIVGLCCTIVNVGPAMMWTQWFSLQITIAVYRTFIVGDIWTSWGGHACNTWLSCQPSCTKLTGRDRPWTVESLSYRKACSSVIYAITLGSKVQNVACTVVVEAMITARPMNVESGLPFILDFTILYLDVNVDLCFYSQSIKISWVLLKFWNYNKSLKWLLRKFILITT